jgi:hypothetical protein
MMEHIKRSREDVIYSGDWSKLTGWEKTLGMIDFSEGDFDIDCFGSFEDFIVWNHFNKINEKKI